MASSARKYDCFIFGGGLAGCVLAQTLIQQGKQPLVIDRPEKSRCSQVAAGLINPIGGRRLNLIWKANTLIPFATAFYQALERRYETPFFYPRPIARLFASLDERNHWQAKAQRPDYLPWTAPLDSLKTPDTLGASNEDGFAVQGSGYLDMPRLLSVLRKELAAKDAILEAEFSYAEIKPLEPSVIWREHSAAYAIFCEGHLATANPWFSFVPYKPAKGVIGRIVSDIQFNDTAIIKKYFLLPRHDQTIHVGATYNWEQLDDTPDSEGIAELEAFLERMLGDRWEWATLAAGVRPATAGAKPVVGPSPEHPRILSFNGFGSKGSTQTPYFAQALHDFLWSDNALSPEILPTRFFKKPKAPPKRWIAVEIARNRVLEIVNPGDAVVDATTGNGHDTLWLARKTGSSGRVFAFDVQPQAIENARQRLQEASCESQVQFINDCHSKLSDNLPANTNISAAIFNLGYLPGGDKRVITRPDTTIEALEQSLDRLKSGGVLSVVLYPGHEGGNDESAEILRWAKELDPLRFRYKIERHPAGIANSPFPLFVFKQ